MNQKKGRCREAVLRGGKLDGKSIWLDEAIPLLAVVSEISGETIKVPLMKYRLESNKAPLEYRYEEISE
jgi:hypothetical protein